MPTNANAQAVSLITAFVLMLALVELGYLNSTIQGVVWSLPFLCAAVVISAAMWTKFAHGVGITGAMIKWADRFASLVPALTVVIFGWQALHYGDDGTSGWMATLAVGGVVGAVFTGISAPVQAFFHDVYEKASDVLDETQVRLADVTDAAAGRGRNR
jgi:hypothetical protein